MKRNLIFTALLIIVAFAAFMIGRSMQHDTTPSVPADGTREIAYWRAPMDPTEIYDAPGQSKMGMDLVPVYVDEQEQAPGATDSGTLPASRKIAYWRAPMDPTEIYDAPGQSKMGMDLVPVYEDEAGASSGGMVTIDPAIVQNMGVRTEVVHRMDLSRTIRTVGEVQYDEERLYIVNAKISGWIEKLYVNFVGEEVRKGAPLMEIYSPDLVTTQEEYLLARKNYDLLAESSLPSARADAERLLESARKRLDFWDVPTAEIERLEKTGAVSKTILLRAPASGIVIEKHAIEGAHIQAGMDLFQIADLRSVWVHASFYDNEVPWINKDQPVEMELSYLPGKHYQGRVSYIYPYLREKARDVHVRLVFSNPDLDLKPGMYANVELQGSVMPGALVVPSQAVIRSGARTLAFVVRAPGQFEPREIRIGEEGGPNNRYLHVLSGLLEGEEVVTSAQFMLDSESRLQEAIQKMLQDKAGVARSAAEPQEEMDHATMDH